MRSIITKEYFSKRIVSLTLVFIALLMVTMLFTTQNYRKPDFIRYDMSSYYGYLPAFFIHHDLSLKFNDKEQSTLFMWVALVEDGKIFRTTMGVSLLLLPFYGLGEFVTWLCDFDRTGYTPVYYFCLSLAPIFYLLVGLWFSMKVLRLYISEASIAISMLALVLATNVFYYVIYEGIMSHIYSFSLYAIFIYGVVFWHKKPTWSLSALIGFAFGMLVLLRPINGISVLLFLLYDFENIRLKIRHIQYIFFIGFVSLLCVFPQMIYWKIYAGHWIYYSYGKEGFFFLDAKFLNELFSFRNGWLTYTPVMGIAIVGMVLMFKKYKNMFWCLSVFTIAYIYVVSSWWCWWYGGSFGSRAMVDIYAVLLIPFGVFVEMALKKMKIVLIVFLVLCSTLSLFQTWQYNSGILHFDGMNRKLYMNIFGATEFTREYQQLRSYPNYEEALEGKRDE
jgi:hypothetical protein